jgi:hypothetical protein
MSNDDVITLVAAAAGALGLVAWVGLIVVPAWRSYWKLWQRLGALVLSVYVLATFVGLGAVLGIALVWLYTRYA